ncbi:putative RNA polymerase II subunit B1 CTD phosphatase RPAP2 homolog [Nymphaea colorata]|uniref:putative RNA polymerase II subunit B1 CTD phosphatase RPAP2 homolog n=1 Tax=Nymphaea colorata TaxID=210225 RepID=UPI00129ED054|nr:putative RNA polymerase II subunit B1 CTD phosphatase RPAP2 homolog [Nymphaea colorata]
MGKPSPSIGDYADAVYKLQLALLDGIADEKKLLLSGSLLSRSDYEDVVTERTIVNICGYPLCDNTLPSDRPKKGRYRISLREHRVYDLRETFLYCSPGCLLKSRAFAETLNAERCTDLDHDKISRVLSAFSEGGGSVTVEKDDGLGFPELKILERLDLNEKGKVPPGECVGPSDAIEGYVPQKDWNRSLKSSLLKKASEGAKNEMTTGSSQKRDKKNASANLQYSKGNSDKFNSDVTIGKECSDDQSLSITSSCVISPGDVGVSGKENQTIERKIDPKKTKLKSCLKSPRVKRSTSKVKWADEAGDKNEVPLSSDTVSCSQSINSVNAILNFHDGEVETTHGSCEGADGPMGDDIECSFRLASAKVCAAALSEAAEAIASGKYDDNDPASKAGIIIIPPDHDINEADLKKVTEETLPAHNQSTSLKISSLSSDIFDPDNSWFDSPPEGFSLTLSSFATMWMALFGWITASSLVYIYGRDESAVDDFLLVNGREYPRKIVIGDGLSSEIKQTLAGCLSRALPSLIASLRVATPISTLEQAMGRLLDTMSFFDPVPSFRTKQWHVIVLLFLDALSVHRVPSLTACMASRTMLAHKVLDGAQVSIEEYDVMKDLILPLGRDPGFSAQSGG